MEFFAILIVLVAGFSALAIRRHWLRERDAAMTAATGGEWRMRSELPLNPGPPYADFGADLLLASPSDVMEGTDEGFQVAYFTMRDTNSGRRGTSRPAAIVQVPVETPKFRYRSAAGEADALRVLESLRRETPPHYENGTAGRVGPLTAEVLTGARGVVVQTAMFAVWVHSRGASSEEVNRLALALAKAIVADAKGTAA